MPIVPTARLGMFVRERPGSGPRVLLVHGNVSSGVFFEPLVAALPQDWHVVVPDLRGYGETEALPLDASRGLDDHADDLSALLDALGWTSGVHALGWSLGGGVVARLAMARPQALASLTLVAPVSPRGYGGTRDVDGRPNAPDFAGSGGGTVNPGFVAAIAAGDRSDGPGSPRDVMRRFYFHTWRPDPELEEAFLGGMLHTRTGEDFYPGDFVPSPHWPNVAPGRRGVANALSPAHLSWADIVSTPGVPPILWARGAHDQIVGDTSAFDLAVLGAAGLVPGWPGADACPPQPMIAQTRAVLDALRSAGGTYDEAVFEHSGHSPFLEEQAAFLNVFTAHVHAAQRAPDHA